MRGFLIAVLLAALAAGVWAIAYEQRQERFCAKRERTIRLDEQKIWGRHADDPVFRQIIEEGVEKRLDRLGC
jgi:hypothetical protein